MSEVSLVGNTGLIRTPSAYFSEDKTLITGLSYIPKTYSFVYYNYTKNVGEKLFFVNLTYLPFLEITARIARPDHIKNNLSGIGDRSFSVRVKLFDERKHRPAIAVGISDPIGTGYLNETYVVTGKSFSVTDRTTIKIHVGYGLDWDKVKTRIEDTFHWVNIYQNQGNRQSLAGVYGGVSVRYGKYLIFTSEYDSKKINGGLKVNLFKRLQLSALMLGMKAFTGSINYRFQL